MTDDAVRLEADGQVALVTLTRPDRRNALDAGVCRALTAALRDRPVDTRVVLLRGEGPAFCAGANLKGGVYSDDFFTALEEMLSTVVGLPVPVIADVQGPAVGAGCQLSLACDLRIAGPEARWWIPAVHHGFALDPWTVSRAVELLGGSVARNVLVAGSRIGQAEALASGFVVEVGTPQDALVFAHRVAGQAPLATAWFKKALNRPGDPTLAPEALACWTSRDVQEARRARAEKRPPVFEGR